jgi:hypothetical protein
MCDYDLRGVTGRRCPECGYEMASGEEPGRGGAGAAVQEEEKR